MATKSVTNFTATRISFTTTSSYDQVLAKLNSEILTNGQVDVKDLVETDKENFVDYFTKKAGNIGFVKFGEFSYGWAAFFGVGDNRRALRVILGNPLIAITMLEHDLGASLFVPVELLLQELPGGKGTQVIYQQPSSLITGTNPDPKLRQAAEVLDGKLETLIAFITQE
jgi:uncharacterized protein (DUF302 family)